MASDRYQVFLTSHQDTSTNTTNIVAFQINKTLKDKQRFIDIFVDNAKELIIKLSDEPDNETLHQILKSRLKKYQPDVFAFNIMNKAGEPIIGDFKGNIGGLCLQDLRQYQKSGEQHIRLHSNSNGHHYDIISKYYAEGNEHLFFVSFHIDEITEILQSTQPMKHNLMLINKGQNNLIEVTTQESAETQKNRPNHKMTGAENQRVLSSTEVKGSDWRIIDMHDEDLFRDYKKKIVVEYLIAYYIFTIIVLFMRNILLKQDEKRTTAEEQLQKNNTQIKDLNNQLELLSRTDSLTGLYNRRYFDEMILQEWNRCSRSKQPLSCILMDIDYFKDYNDTYGHQSGDKCLKDLSLVMKDTFRRAGDIVARYGGEEFIIIMSDTNKEEAEATITLFKKELKKLRILNEASSIDKYVTISCGLITQTPSQSDSIEDFIRKADKALYQAKDKGRNQCVSHS
jgi:diguanylate cyclase (GGDEF)-like protein